MILRLEEDLSSVDESHVRYRLPIDEKDGQVATIRIAAPGKAMPEERLAALCHELGHVAGAFIGTPAATQDQRFLIRGNNRVQEAFGYTDETIRAEEEAWEIAEQIFQNIKTKALKSYRDNRENKA